MNACEQLTLAKGWVRHSRYHPKSHTFIYSLAYVNIDATLIDSKLSPSKPQPIAINTFGLVSVNRKDLIKPINLSIKEAVNQKLIESGSALPEKGRIVILTLPRFFGYTFNPVSFYTVYNADNSIHAIFSDITNTPWGERHTYVHLCENSELIKQDERKEPATHKFYLDKQFHVSPFMPMQLFYDWRFKLSDEKQVIHMRLLDPNLNSKDVNDDLIFDVTFNLNVQPYSKFTSLYLSVIFILLPVKVVFGIYWNALVLWMKGVSFLKHPKHENSNG